MAGKQDKDLRFWQPPEAEADPFEVVLANHIKDVVAELSLTDVGVLTSFISKDLHANVEDLVESSTELFFKDGTLRYGHLASVSFEWGAAPTVTLDLEFVHRSVSVFFKLVLHRHYFGVAIQRILLDERSRDPEADLRHFADVLNNARLVPLPAQTNS
ncbi:hypothetical protein [Microvirga roseola]|uniref:hypothetical protein n=1 Tax=Microvirga roseola TaxID=2883126 RepID=UPI001E5381B6|nr:hypothetical protein [Microvirga roseola]